jgi:acyl carrier protein
MSAPEPIDAQALAAWMSQYICAVLGLEEATLDPAASFDSYGLDSAEAVIMAGAMEEEFGVEIEPSLFFDEPTIGGVVAAFRAAGLAA